MLCRKARVLPVECIVRGYLTGSGLKEYEQSGMVCGIPLRAGLSNSDPLDEPIFTPSTKADAGHDENISYDEACRIVGESEMAQVRATAMQIYGEGRRYALERGVIIADTKFEFGILPGEQAPILIDEVLTPDSSRFWPAADWRSGTEQDSFDKQFVRNFTESLVTQGLWNKEAPGPALPDDVIHQTQARYQEAIDRLMG
jgi:phosphoribosylaminoimidazole-succinocarboxamide synthase